MNLIKKSVSITFSQEYELGLDVFQKNQRVFGEIVGYRISESTPMKTTYVVCLIDGRLITVSNSIASIAIVDDREEIQALKDYIVELEDQLND